MDVQILFCVTGLLFNGHTHTHILCPPSGVSVYIHGGAPLWCALDLNIIITTTNKRV